MLDVFRKLLCATTYLVLLVMSACVPPHSHVELAPDLEAAKLISVDQAREYVKQGLQGGDTVQVYEGTLLKSTVSSVQITPRDVKVSQANGITKTIRLEGMRFGGIDDDFFLADKDWHNKPGESHLYIHVEIHDNEMNQNMQRTVNALYVLKQTAESEAKAEKEAKQREDDRRFNEALHMYKTAAVKPQLSEDARKFKIQAEDAVREKDFAGAVGLYEQALKIAPWWPEGHFNRALVLGETKAYETAIIEMKRYLALAPNASNARAAQDKVYAWERKAGKGN